MKRFFGILLVFLVIAGAVMHPPRTVLADAPTPVPTKVTDNCPAQGSRCKTVSDCNQCDNRPICTVACNGLNLATDTCGYCQWSVGNECSSWGPWSACIVQPPGMPCASAQTRSCLLESRPYDLEVCRSGLQPGVAAEERRRAELT